MSYNHKKVESKWQKHWSDSKLFKTNFDSNKEKYYVLDMFPYPSGSGLHVGHIEGYTATDIVARFKRMQGFEVLHPMGWDSFGLPAEQYALSTGNQPKDFTNENIANFKRQINDAGFSYDWDLELATTDEKYYKWTQWIFTQLVKGVPYNRDKNNIVKLAEISERPVNWCQELGTVLSNEEVIDGKSERGGFPVEKINLRQWELDIVKYADRLIEDLDDLDWPESLKNLQRNWIGKSIGTNIQFKIDGIDEFVEVFTSRSDTLFGVTYLVISPEHLLVSKLGLDNNNDVKSFMDKIKNLSDLERTELNKDKSGVFTGLYGIHPITKEKLEIWIGDYVLNSYGTGAVMAVPAHDQRDYEFAKKYNLEIKQIIEGDISENAHTADGIHINSDFINGLNIIEAKEEINNFIEDNKLGKREVNYKLNKWLFSRQRYWGEPIPVLFSEDGKYIVEENLPLLLPETDKIEPAKDMVASPLVNIKDWINVEIDGNKYIRENNTMPQWAGSCWYYLRFIDVNNNKELVNKEKANKWLPVDLYIGGAEHAVLHLLYARFWHKVLYDLEIVDHKEPFKKLFNQGMILGNNNEKMSKSKGNVVNPDDIIEKYGADTLRLYEMFMGPLADAKPWSTENLEGSRRFIERIYRLYIEQDKITNDKPNEKTELLFNQTIKKVTEDFEKLNFNTAISQLMIFINHIYKEDLFNKSMAIDFIKLINPLVPHIAEEIWNTLEQKEPLTFAEWPSYDTNKLSSNEILIVIQINGKLKERIELNEELSEEIVKEMAISKCSKFLEDKEIVKIIYIKNKIVNIVVR